MEISVLVSFLEEASLIMNENRDRLIELDSVTGDGDLGLTMTRGFEAASAYANETSEKDAGKLLYNAGKTMSSHAPSTMGTLMAVGLMQAGKVLKGKESLTEEDLAAFLEAYEDGIMTRGKAKLGDKTFLDAFDPAAKAFREALNSGSDLVCATEAAVKGAEEGYVACRAMRAVHGKAAVKGELSCGMDDPGAAVAVLIIQALQKTILKLA